MALLGCKEIDLQRGRNPTFAIQGQVHHWIGSLCPIPNEDASFALLYFLGEEEVQTQCKIFPGVKQHVIHDLQELLHNCIVYVNSLKMATDFITDSSNRDDKIVINAD